MVLSFEYINYQEYSKVVLIYIGTIFLFPYYLIGIKILTIRYIN